MASMLGQHPFGSQSAGHGQRLRVVAEAEVFEPALAGGDSHLLHRSPGRRSSRSGRGGRRAARKIDQIRERAFFGRLDLPLVLAQLGRDVAQAHQAVDLGLGGARDEAARFEMLDVVLADLVAPALGVTAQRHVVVGTAGEVLQQVAVGRRGRPSAGRRAGRCGVAPANLVSPCASHAASSGEAANAAMTAAGRRGGHQVDVAHRRAAAAQAAGEVGGHHRGRAAQRRHQPGGLGLDHRPQAAAPPGPRGRGSQVSMARRMLPSVFSPMPGNPRSRPSRAALSSRGGRRLPRSPTRSRVFLGPIPGSRITCRSPSGYRSPSLARKAMSPVATYSSTLVSMASPIPGSRRSSPRSAMSATETGWSRKRAAAFSYAMMR